MLENQEEIRKRIINIRKERGLSQNQLAKDFGISRTHYCNVENGKKPITESFLKVLANGYKISMDTFIPSNKVSIIDYHDNTHEFATDIILEYLNDFTVRRYYIDEFLINFPYFALLSYLAEVDYVINYEKIRDPYTKEIFDPVCGDFDYVDMDESGFIHIYSAKTNKEVARIPTEKLRELEREVKSFVDYKLSAFRPAKAKKRTSKQEEYNQLFEYEEEMKRLTKYKKYIDNCIKELKEMKDGGII